MWTLSSAPIWETGTEKRLVESYCYYYLIIVVVVALVVDDDTYYWVYCLVLRPSISSLLQSATPFFITKREGLLPESATSVMTKCDRYYKVRQNRCWVVRNVQNLRHFFSSSTPSSRILWLFFVAENVFWKCKLTLLFRAKIGIGNRMICSDIWHKYHGWYFEIVIRNFKSRYASEIWDNFEISRVVYLCQISRTNDAIICLYYTNRKSFVIFTCRYFKLSWNTTALSQSNCRNSSCSSINTVI